MNLYCYQKEKLSGRFSIDWTKTFEGIKIPEKKQDCLDCDSGKICSDCVIKPRMNCFSCEMQRAHKTRLDLICPKKTYSTEIKLLKRKSANENYQKLLHYEGKFEPGQNIIDFECAREILMIKDDKMVVKIRFERINDMMECKSFVKNEVIPENKEMFVYGFSKLKQLKSIIIP